MQQADGKDVKVVAEAPAASSETEMLDQLVEEHSPDKLPQIGAGPLGPAPLVGECLDDRHPTLSGRVRVRWKHGAESAERWVAVLLGTVVRTHDRVLMVQPDNWPEPLVVGVIDGFTERRESPTHAAQQLELRGDEHVAVCAEDGEPLVELYKGESGPVVRIMNENTDVRFAGKLRLRAKAIDLEAEEGEVNVTATDDVNLKGEIIHLN